MTWAVRETCRLCGGKDLPTVLELAPTPPANEFVKHDDPAQDPIPLYLAQCADCGHVQLPVVVNPNRLFSNYVYVSGTSPAFVQHFKTYAEETVKDLNLQPGSLVVDIGSNDGTLLREYQRLGMRVLGVDPAKRIAARATHSGITTLPEFFTRETARKILDSYGDASLVVANNVFAHADDLEEIAMGARDLLRNKRGSFLFEVSYLVHVIQRTLFDTIYHEHLSYHTLAPLVPFFDRLRMSLVDAQIVETHGGSVRCRVDTGGGINQSDRLSGLIKVERAEMANQPFTRLKAQIDEAGYRVRAFFKAARLRHLKVAGYGAPAKMTTLAHQFRITKEDVRYVVDDSVWKQGLLSPGTRIPVVSPAYLAKDQPDSVFVFAWNFAQQIAAKLPDMAGRIVTPLPTYQVM